MKIAKFAESDRAKRLSQLLIKRGRLLGIFLFCVGIIIYCLLPLDGLCREKFFDENALLTGLVNREFSDSSLLTHLQTQYKFHYNKTDVHHFVKEKLISFGLEVFTHNYTASRVVTSHDKPQVSQYSGINTYGILRAGRSSSVEALVLTAPDVLGDDEENSGVVVLLALAKYFSSKNYWSKDIIFLVSSNGVVGIQAWVNSYMGVHSPSITSHPLTGRSGAIQGVINLEINTGNIGFMNIVPEGVNAILPNLDLVYVASSLCEQEKLQTTFHVNWDSPGLFSPDTHYAKSLLTSTVVLAHHATGLPLTNHAPFLKHRIDSLTLKSIPGTSFQTKHSVRQLKDLARALEGIFRSLNNLLERLHHSEFFYILMSRDTFVSIGQYSPFFGLLLAPLILESLRQWMLVRGSDIKSVDRPTTSDQPYIDKMGIPPSLSFSLTPLLQVLMFSLASGCGLYYYPTLITFIISPITPEILLGGSLIICVVVSIATILFRISLSEDSYHVSSSILLLLLAICLYSLALMHFAFSLVITISLSIPLSLTTSRNIWSRISLMIVFPPFLLFYLCFSYTLLFPSSSSSQELLNSSLHLLLHGSSLSYSSHYFSGVWLFPLCTLLLWPMWLLCWILGWIRIIIMGVSIKLNEPHPHSD